MTLPTHPDPVCCQAEARDNRGTPWLCTLKHNHAMPHEAHGKAGEGPFFVWTDEQLDERS